MGQLDTKAIISPRLNIPGYGKGVDDAFKAIEENFRIVANRDFVKGDRGYSVCTMVYPLVINNAPEKKNPDKSDLYLTDVGVYTINAILKNLTASTDDSLDPLTGMYRKYINEGTLSTSPTGHLNLQGVVDAINNSTSSELSWAQSLKEDSYTILDWISPNDKFVTLATYDPSAAVKTYNVVASLNTYVFKDGRFNRNNITTDIEKYSGKEDASCTIYIQASETSVTTKTDESITNFEGKFMVLNNIPTLYYDNTLNTFCWKLNGQETSMIAQGPAGNNGANQDIHIFQVELVKGDIYKVTNVLYTDDNGSTNWVEVTPENTDDIAIGGGAVVFIYNQTGEKTQAVYFTNVISKNIDNKGKVNILVYCAVSNEFPIIVAIDELEKCMNAIAPNNLTKSLHIPYQTKDRENGYKHTIWSTGDNDKEQLNIGPLYYGKYFESNKDSIDSKEPVYHRSGKLKIYYKDFELGFPEFDSNGKVNSVDYNKLAFKNGVLRIGTGVIENATHNDMLGNDGKYFAVDGSDIYLGNDVYKIVGKFAPITYNGYQYYHYMLSSLGGTTEISKSNPSMYINTGGSMSSINDPGMFVIGTIKDNIPQNSLRLDDARIQAIGPKNNASILYLNEFGGPVDICNHSFIVGEGRIDVKQPLYIANTISFDNDVWVNNKITASKGYKAIDDKFTSILTGSSIDFSNTSGSAVASIYPTTQEIGFREKREVKTLHIDAPNIIISANKEQTPDGTIFDGTLDFQGYEAKFQCTMYPKVISIGVNDLPLRFRSSQEHQNWNESTRIWIADWGIGNVYDINIMPYNADDCKRYGLSVPRGGLDNEITIVLDNRLPVNAPITIIVHSDANKANPAENSNAQEDLGCDIHFVWEWDTWRSSNSQYYQKADESGWDEYGRLNKSYSRCFKGVQGEKYNKATVTVYRSGNALDTPRSGYTSGWVLLCQSVDGAGAGNAEINTQATTK